MQAAVDNKPANLLMRQASELPMDDDQIAKLLTWSVDDTCGWLKGVGLDGFFEKQFREHEISGDILPLIDLNAIKDMDNALVGPRTQLLKKLAKLKRTYINYKRNRNLWDGREQRYSNPCECMWDYVISCCCPDPADKYNLTSAHLKIEQKVYPYGKCFKCCFKGNDMNSIDLGHVLDVDSMSHSNCCGCGRDIVVIKSNSVNKTDDSKMFLPVGQGPKVARIIRDAIEESQSVSKLAGTERI